MKNIPLFLTLPLYTNVKMAYNNGMKIERERNMDQEVIKKIKRYIEINDISLTKLARTSKIPYHRLWVILNQSYTIKLGDYVALCKAFKEPFDFFIPK